MRGYAGSVLRPLAWIAAAAWTWALAVALDDRRNRRDLDEAAPEEAGPRVTAVVPARNEAGRIGPALRSLAAQTYQDLEVVVVDDESDDATAAEAEAVARETGRVRVVRGVTPPPGWVGKSWAVDQGVRVAQGEWLLFTDADVVHAPDVLARALPLARRLGTGGLTLLPELVSDTWSERIVQPAAAVLIRSFVTPGPLIRSRRSRVALAAGAFILVERRLYERTGGHAAIRGEVVDDRRLAELVKAHGGLLALVGAPGRLHVRMYRGLGETWRGWRKNTSAGVGSVGRAVFAAGAGAVVAVAPLAALIRGPRRVGALGVVLQLLVRADVDPLAPTPRRYWTTLPLGALFLSVLSLASSRDRLRGGLTWRGRVVAETRRFHV